MKIGYRSYLRRLNANSTWHVGAPITRDAEKTLLERSTRERVTPRVAAEALARDRVTQAMSYRHRA